MKSDRAPRRRVHLLAAALVLASCAVNPVAGERELVLVSAAQEAAQRRAAAARVERDVGLVRDPDLVAYVASIGVRLVKHLPRPDAEYRFFVADMSEPNAFALPGGYVYVSRGLLAIANSEAELANVIGHEIGHVAASHAAQPQTRSLGVGLLSVLGAVAVGGAGGGETAQQDEQLGQLVAAGLIASYSLDQERQADEIGQRLAAEAGWDPAGMSWFLAALERTAQLRRGGERPPSFLDLHPSTRERAAATSERARSLGMAHPQARKTNSDTLMWQIDGLLLGDDPAAGVFRGDGRFLYPDLDFELRFPAAWRHRNTPTRVIAMAPEGGAALLLERGDPIGDPCGAAAAFATESRLELDPRPYAIGVLAACQTQALLAGPRGDHRALLTWIAHPRAMLQLTGLAPVGRFAVELPRFREVAESFRALADEERHSIRERRLRVLAARRGETLAELAHRGQNRWSLRDTVAANGLPGAGFLARGRLVKIAVEQSYMSR